MSGNDEHIGDIEDIKRSARRSTDPSDHNAAIIKLAELTKTRTGNARKIGLIAITEIGNVARWHEQKNLAFEKIAEIIREDIS